MPSFGPCAPRSRLIDVLHRNTLLVFLAFFAALLLVYRPAEIPPLFFDEGWNLLVARNWSELGHYGPLLNGQPAHAGISTGFPAIIPIALIFKLFGIGAWQARLSGIIFSACAYILIWYLSCRLYDRNIAICTLAVLLLMPAHPELHSMLIGRQALGEMPAIFYILAGYACFLSSCQGRSWPKFLTPIWWGLALITKAQVIPFLFLALIVPLSVSVYMRRWKLLKVISTGLIGSMAVFWILTICQEYLLHDPMPVQINVGNWSNTIAVLIPSVRIRVLSFALIFGLPIILAFFYTIIKSMMNRREYSSAPEISIIRLSLLTLCVGWIAWYVLFSAGFLRYMFPPLFLGGIFTAAMLSDFTTGFNPPQLGLNRRAICSLLATALVLFSVFPAIHMLYTEYSSNSGKDYLHTIDFINSRTPKKAIIGSAEVELFFLINRPYLYGSDKYPVSLPLRETFDYLIIGPTARIYNMQNSALSLSRYKQIAAFGKYEIYERSPLSGIYY